MNSAESFNSIPEILSVSDVARAMNLSCQSIRIHINMGKLAARKVNGRFQITRKQFIEYAERVIAARIYARK